MGDLIADVSARRGTIASIQSRNDLSRVHAQVPLAGLFGYATAIRSLSHGRASYSMEPLRFDPVPENVQQQLLERFGYAIPPRN
jgi:elongation factor G